MQDLIALNIIVDLILKWI